MDPISYNHLLILSARTVIVLLTLVMGLRALGKRELGQMNIFDLVLILALANAVQNAMTEGRGNLSVGFVSAGSLLIVGRLVSSLFVRLPRLEQQLVGTPTILVNDGHCYPDRLRRESVSHEELITALRQHGLCSVSEAKLVVLEVDGSLSVVPKPKSEDPTLS